MLKYAHNGKGISIICRTHLNLEKKGAYMAISYDKLFKLLKLPTPIGVLNLEKSIL